MKSTTYNSFLLLMTVLLFIWIAVAASTQSERNKQLKDQNTILCESKTDGEFIANSLGCFIKVEQ